MLIQTLVILFALAVAYAAGAKVVVPAFREWREVQARNKAEAAKRAFDAETDRLEKLCEIGPYSPLAKAMAAEEERERQAAINARKREINEIRWQAKKERAAALAAEGERRRRELEAARVCRDGGEHAVSASAMKCRICGKPYNPFVPRGYDPDYRRPNPSVGERYAREKRRLEAERAELMLMAGMLDKTKTTAELVIEALADMHNDRWR